MTINKPLLPEQDRAITKRIQEDRQTRKLVGFSAGPRVYVSFNGSPCELRRPFRKRGHYAVRLQGTAWLTSLPDGANVSTDVFSVTYSPDFLKCPRSIEGE